SRKQASNRRRANVASKTTAMTTKSIPTPHLPVPPVALAPATRRQQTELHPTHCNISALQDLTGYHKPTRRKALQTQLQRRRQAKRQATMPRTQQPGCCSGQASEPTRPVTDAHLAYLATTTLADG